MMEPIPGARWIARRCSGCWTTFALARLTVVVVYKVDRLTRSLADFAKIVEVFDAQGVSFVPVTQAFIANKPATRVSYDGVIARAGVS